MIEGVEADDVRGQHALEKVFSVGQSPAANRHEQRTKHKPEKRKKKVTYENAVHANKLPAGRTCG